MQIIEPGSRCVLGKGSKRSMGPKLTITAVKTVVARTASSEVVAAAGWLLEELNTEILVAVA